MSTHNEIHILKHVRYHGYSEMEDGGEDVSQPEPFIKAGKWLTFTSADYPRTAVTDSYSSSIIPCIVSLCERLGQ